MTAIHCNHFINLFSGIAKTVEVLIEEGADVNAVDNEHSSALFLAAREGNSIARFCRAFSMISAVEIDVHGHRIYYSRQVLILSVSIK